ncbi:MAG: hypothetical protein U5L08_02065 [Xanthomonadales bacterium]|nr:hypothetical protein [Xanthomonadales bacterium]
MKVPLSIFLILLVAAGNALSQSPPELFGTTWKVDSCYNEPTPNSSLEECKSKKELLPGSLLGLMLNEKGKVVVQFQSSEPPATIEIEAESWDYCSIDCDRPTFTAFFTDWSGTSTVPKKLQAILVRSGGEDTHDPGGCVEWLSRAEGSHLPKATREDACNLDNMIYWRLINVVGPSDPPGDGHGTGTPP